jgi:hypothetical protein
MLSSSKKTHIFRMSSFERRTTIPARFCCSAAASSVGAVAADRRVNDVATTSA